MNFETLPLIQRVNLDKEDQLALQVFMDLRVNKENQVRSDPLESLGDQEFLENLDGLESKEKKDQWDLLVQLESPEELVHLDFRDFQEREVFQDLLESQD